MSKFSSANHYLSRDHHTFTFAADNTPALVVADGDVIHVQTWDCYKGTVQEDENALDEPDLSLANPATGPIFVTGAQPGDMLAVTIVDILPERKGVCRLFHGEGQLCDSVKAPYVKFFSVVDGLISMNERVRFPSRPMLGVIGLAPEGDAAISTMPAGKHGGNLDNNMNGIGSTIYLPVKHEGALLSIGDMHASMGDGEICGNGLEIGGDVLIRVGVIKLIGTAYPVTETNDSWITHGVADQELDEGGLFGAMKIACDEAADLLVRQWGFSREDAFVFLSVAGDLGIAQACHPSGGSVIAKMKVPKITACPRPFNI